MPVVTAVIATIMGEKLAPKMWYYRGKKVMDTYPRVWSEGRQPSGAVLHSSRELGVRHPCSDFMDMLRRLVNCRIIIIIIIIILLLLSCSNTAGVVIGLSVMLCRRSCSECQCW